MSNKPTFSEKLKKAREQLGLSQAQAALAWGVNKRTLQAWERGANTPHEFTIREVERIIEESLKGL
ncbi:MAG: helix-turn-helix transcriptional regulator [Verrucomicrobiota bacterium]